MENAPLESKPRELSIVRNPCYDLTRRKNSKIVNQGPLFRCFRPLKVAECARLEKVFGQVFSLEPGLKHGARKNKFGRERPGEHIWGRSLRVFLCSHLVSRRKCSYNCWLEEVEKDPRLCRRSGRLCPRRHIAYGMRKIEKRGVRDFLFQQCKDRFHLYLSAGLQSQGA